MEKKWKVIKDTPPPKDELIWGYDVFYEDVHVCMWEGDLTDDGIPFPTSKDVRGDDYSIGYWMEMEQQPEPPNVVIEED